MKKKLGSNICDCYQSNTLCIRQPPLHLPCYLGADRPKMTSASFPMRGSTGPLPNEGLRQYLTPWEYFGNKNEESELKCRTGEG